MNSELFNIENFNIIQDENNYYFFRALNKADTKDIKEGIIVNENGKIERIRTDRERYEGTPKYNQDSVISLEEVFDHIKMSYRKDTNCISLSSNANVSAMYGRGFYNDTYAMIKVPKRELGKTVFHAGPYMMQEIQKEIDDYVDSENIDLLLKYYIDYITYAPNEEAIDRILKSYSEDLKKPDVFKKGIEYGFDTTEVIEYNALNKNQNLEKRKLIAKLDIISKRIIPHVSNKFLIQTVGNAFSSLELINYNDIDGSQVTYLSKEVIDMFSLVQQLPSQVAEPIKRDLLEKVLNNSLELSEFSYNNVYLNSSNYSIEEMYNLTNGNINYYDAINIKNRVFTLAKSKLRTNYIIDNLNKNLPQYKDIFEKEKNNLYGIEPNVFSRLSKYNMSVSESVSLDLAEQERIILDFVEALSDEELSNIVSNPIQTLSVLLNNHSEFGDNRLTKDEYYASALVDMYDWTKLHIKYILPEQKKEIINKLIENHCVDIYEDFKKHNTPEEYIPFILLTKVIKDLDYKEIDLNRGFSVDELEDFLGYYEVNDTKIRLRSYQAAAVENIEKKFKEKQFVSAILPTGSGKSFVALTEMEQYKDKKILYLAPNAEILNQLSNHIVTYIHGKKYTTGKDRRTIVKETFPNLEMQTYAYLTDNHTDIRDQKYDLIVWDELHRTGAKEWGRNIQKLLSHQDETTKILSVTATPQRDMDNRNMADEWAEHFGYTAEEIARHEHLAINMDLEEAIRQGFVMHPKIVNCEYNLQNGELDNLLEILQSYPDSEKKTKVLRKFDELRDRVANADKVDQILKDNIKKGGKYIVFLPAKNAKGQEIEDENGTQLDSRRTGKNLIEEYKQTLLNDLAGYIDEDEIEFHSMLGAYSKSKNEAELNQFENSDSDKTKFIFVINKLNEGKHVEGVNGMIWYRPLDENSRILYLQQLGRIIYGIDPTKELPDDERTVAIDLVNNTYRVNINRKRREVTSDIDKLYTVISWMELHGYKIPDINSTNRQEARYASTLKRIKDQYFLFVENNDLIEKESNSEEINAVIFLGTSIDLWNIDIPEREKQEQEDFLDEDFEVFSVTGVLRDLYELKEEIDNLGLSFDEKLNEIIVYNPGKRSDMKFSDNSAVMHPWKIGHKNDIIDAALKGNEKALQIARDMEWIDKSDKLHEYRLKVEELGRLVYQSENFQFISGTKMGSYWFNHKKEIKQLAQEGNEDALFILSIANKKIDKLHELRLKIEELGRIVTNSAQDKLLKFSDGSSMSRYWDNNKKSLEQLAQEGNEDAIFILSITNEKIDKLHEYRLKVEELGCLIKKSAKFKSLTFSDGVSMATYWNYSKSKIEQLAQEGNEDAIAIINIANSSNKIHEYRVQVERENRLIPGSSKLTFSDGSQMRQFWKDNKLKIEKLAQEGNGDALFILEIANRQSEQKIDKLHEYRLKVEELGRLVMQKEEIMFSDNKKMGYYWNRIKDKIEKLVQEGNEDAIVILNIANNNKIDKIHEYRVKIEELGHIIRFSKEDKLITFSDGSLMSGFFESKRNKIEQLAQEGNEDAFTILRIANQTLLEQKNNKRKKIIDIHNSDVENKIHNNIAK